MPKIRLELDRDQLDRLVGVFRHNLTLDSVDLCLFDLLRGAALYPVSPLDRELEELRRLVNYANDNPMESNEVYVAQQARKVVKLLSGDPLPDVGFTGAQLFASLAWVERYHQGHHVLDLVRDLVAEVRRLGGGQ